MILRNLLSTVIVVLFTGCFAGADRRSEGFITFPSSLQTVDTYSWSTGRVSSGFEDACGRTVGAKAVQEWDIKNQARMPIAAYVNVNPGMYTDYGAYGYGNGYVPPVQTYGGATLNNGGLGAGYRTPVYRSR